MGLVELSGPVNHVFIRQAGVVGDNPGHSKSRGGTAHCQVASDSVRQSNEAGRIVGALTSTGRHFEGIGRLEEKVHACVVSLSHCSVPNSVRCRYGKPTPSYCDSSDFRSSHPKRRREHSNSEPLRGYTPAISLANARALELFSTRLVQTRTEASHAAIGSLRRHGGADPGRHGGQRHQIAAALTGSATTRMAKVAESLRVPPVAWPRLSTPAGTAGRSDRTGPR